MTVKDAPKSTELAAAPPDSQFSMNWQMVDGYGGLVQVTMRATALAEWPGVFDVRKKFCDMAQEHGWTFPGTVKPTAAAPGLPAPVGKPAAPGLVPPATGAPAPVTAPASNGGAHAILSLNTALLKVKPRDDGKVDLEFWNPGREYAELRATKAPADAAKLLEATGVWTLEHFAALNTYPLAVTISYRLSEKKNKAGNPYKDVIDIRPTAA